MKPSPKALRTLTKEQEKVLASDIRSDILSVAYQNGGHLSPNLGVVELTLSLLKNFDPYKDDILFDVGHQTYAYKILTGRSLKDLRKFGGEPPFSDPDRSPADKYRNGHASTAISVAYGMALAKALKKDGSYTIALVGDSSLASGISMEALGLLATDRKTKLIVVINDNGMSIGKDVSFMGREFQRLRNSRFYFRTSKLLSRIMSKTRTTQKLFLWMRSVKDRLRQMVLKPTVFESMGLKYIGPFSGHDFDELDLAFSKAKSLVENGPVVVHVITKKGYGYPPAMKDEKGTFHGVNSHFDEEKEEGKDNFDYYKKEFLLRKMEEDHKAFVICPAMVYGSDLEEVYRTYPERTIDVGIAEENAVTMASGIALQGYHPVIDIYSTFLQRSYDEVFEDIAREKCPNLFYVERSGLVGEDGPSHQGIYDVSFLRTIPDCQVYMPYDKDSFLRLSSGLWFKKNVPTFIRLTKDAPFNDHGPVEKEEGYDVVTKETGKKLVLAIGPNGMALLEKVKEMAVDCLLLLDLLPSDSLLDRLNLLSYEDIVLYDCYSTPEGTSDTLGRYLLSHGYKGRFLPLTLPKDFVVHGSVKDLYSHLGMDVPTAFLKIRDWLTNKDATEKKE